MNPTARLALCLLAGLAVGLAYAEGEPDAGDMIQALKPGKTRGLRNLTVAPSNAPDSTLPPKNKMPSLDVPPLAPKPVQSSIALAINFESNSYKISQDSRQMLANLAQALRSAELADSRFLIEGHTDAKGSPVHNRKLSQQRAEQVRRDLIARGVASKRLIARGMGSDHPANPSDPFAPENRRVRIVNIDQN